VFLSHPHSQRDAALWQEERDKKQARYLLSLSLLKYTFLLQPIYGFYICDKPAAPPGVEWEGRTNWNQLATGGDAPPARYGHSLVTIRAPASKGSGTATSVILFGGSNQVEFSNEVFALSWRDKRWRVLQEGGPDEDAPPAQQGGAAATMPIKRHFHTAVVWPNPAAASSSNGEPNDNDKKEKKDKKDKKGKQKCEEAEHNHNKEEEAEEGGEKPSPAGKMFVFGGKSNGYLNDLWQFDPGSSFAGPTPGLFFTSGN
jgi:hypothetical protein